ncbi:enoyl-(Acyl carrier protein) reductase domain-containing protein [Phthorimaea operculella]|nr:enoyl-(Acyl carrier protein) reductase domain-containing protein [Phthorimaea operculella]
MDFKNKVIIITGATSGIGEAAAYHFARLSAKLVLTGRNEAKLKEVAAKVEKAKGIKPCTVKADLTNDAEVKKIVDEAIKCFSQIDVLVNNAGAGVIASLKDGIGHFDLMINTNLRSVYLLSHLVAPYLVKSKGNIVNVSSVVSTKPIHESTPYCVSKAGLDMLTKCSARELAADGVRVNSVNPGPVTSEFHDRLGLGKKKTEEMMKDRERMSPLGKITSSEEVAEVIVFLASDCAKSITGSIYVIDNGFLIN